MAHTTHTPHHLTRSQGADVFQVNLFDSLTTSHATTVSATHSPILDQEDAYLCAWLRSRVESTTLTLRDDSALCVTHSDQAQAWRLLRLAKTRGLLPLLRRGQTAASRKVA